MCDEVGLERATEVDDRRISRRSLLGVGAAGLAGTLLPLSASSAASAAKQAPRNQSGSDRLLLRGGVVLTLDPTTGDLPEGDVLIENGKISAVGTRIPIQGAEVIDASGMIVMPGFVDTHRHMWQGLIRNTGADDLLGDYLAKVLFGFAPVMRPDEVYLGNLVAALSAMNAGITTLLDWSHIATTPEHTDAAIQALRDAKVRAVYGYGPNFGLAPPWFENPNQPYPDDIRRLRRQHFSSSDQLLTLALAAAGPEFSSLEAAVREWTIAREVGARISVHAGVGNPGKQGLLQALSQRVQLAEDTTYIHCSTLSDIEWRMIADTGGSVSLAIPVEMQMGHGMPPIQNARGVGIRPSLSVDVETNQPTDMFTQMHACFALQRAHVNEKDLFPGTPPPGDLLTVRNVLEFATIEGARANGLASKIGTLTPGKDADVILLRAKAINVGPVNDPIGAVVLGMDTSNVDSVFIAGRPIKRNGQLVGVDVPQLLDRSAQARDALLRRGRVSGASQAVIHS